MASRSSRRTLAGGLDLGPHIGQRLRRLRKASGLTTKEIRERTGLDISGIYKLEKEHRPNPELATLLLLLDAYDVGSFEEVFGELPYRAVARAYRAEGVGRAVREEGEE